MYPLFIHAHRSGKPGKFKEFQKYLETTGRVKEFKKYLKSQEKLEKREKNR